MRRFQFLMLAVTTSLLVTGCSRDRLIRQSLSPIPEEIKGVMYVATELHQTIPVGIEGTDELLMLDVGGYYLIHKNDLASMMKIIKK